MSWTQSHEGVCGTGTAGPLGPKTTRSIVQARGLMSSYHEIKHPQRQKPQ